VALPVGREVAVFVEFLPEVGPPRLVGADEAVLVARLRRQVVAREADPHVAELNARSNSAR